MPGYDPYEGSLPTADELFGTGPSATPQEIQDAVLSSIGEDVPQAHQPPRGDLPPVHDLAEHLGLA